MEHFGSPLLIVAGPGSGKTRVITEKIKFLLKMGLKPSEILCLTFSEKAANELKERIQEDEDVKEKLTSQRCKLVHTTHFVDVYF